MKKYTYANLLSTMQAIVEEAGRDFVYSPMVDQSGYSGCDYVRDGKPSCGIGHLLYRLGVPLNALKNVNRKVISSLWSELEYEFRMDFSSDAEIFMEEFQDCQDSGYSWGTSLDEATSRAGSAVEN